MAYGSAGPGRRLARCARGKRRLAAIFALAIGGGYTPARWGAAPSHRSALFSALCRILEDAPLAGAQPTYAKGPVKGPVKGDDWDGTTMLNDDQERWAADFAGGARTYIAAAATWAVPPGHLKRVEVNGRLICLANVDGCIYALDDDCPHIGASLSQGALAGATLTCPLHLAQFDARTGKVTRGPARADARMFETRRDGDIVMVRDPNEVADE